MKKIGTHRDLEVYQMAFDSAMQIFELTKRFPKEETYDIILGKLVTMILRPEQWILER